jgi:hypothetical protein
MLGAVRADPCSPRSRGWSPVVKRGGGPGSCSPRARGGGPMSTWPGSSGLMCSPRSRGWSIVGPAGQAHRDVLPALAGVVPPVSRPAAWPAGAPRARGGGPGTSSSELHGSSCSPRLRGWSHQRAADQRRWAVLPAPAGVIPPRGARRSAHSSCSPRLRGWSLGDLGAVPLVLVLPAPAGVVPGRPAAASRPARTPRGCGGGPNQLLLDLEWFTGPGLNLELHHAQPLTPRRSAPPRELARHLPFPHKIIILGLVHTRPAREAQHFELDPHRSTETEAPHNLRLARTHVRGVARVRRARRVPKCALLPTWQQWVIGPKQQCQP